MTAGLGSLCLVLVHHFALECLLNILQCFPAVTGRPRQEGVDNSLICLHHIIKQTMVCQWTWTQLPHTVWFHSDPPLPPPPPAAPCLSLWSCLPRLSTSPVCLPAAPRAFLPHSSLLGRGAPMDGPQGRAVQNANEALCATSHDFPPRHELLFRYWFHYNQTGPVTFLLSGGWSAALTAAQGIPDIRPSFSHSFLHSVIRLCTHLKYLIPFQSFCILKSTYITHETFPWCVGTHQLLSILET